MKAEFDRYARNYSELLQVPLRDGFARSGEFYHLRKWILIADFLRRRGLWRSELAWLDVGCGKCELLSYGRSHFARVAGCDPSREMVRDSNGIEVYLQESPVALPFADMSFDFVTAVCVYHHVGEQDRIPLTRDIHRVLRPKGVFCMIEHNPFNPVAQVIVSQCPLDVDARLLTAGSARRYARKAGLTSIETQYFLYLPEKYYTRIPGIELALRAWPLGGQYAMFGQKEFEDSGPAAVL
jgi:SAM-dependent methyltransferase